MKVISNKGDQYESTDPLFFQQGGLTGSNQYVYASDYTNLSPPQSGTTEKKSKSDSKSDKEDSISDTMKLLGGKGIKSDMQAGIQDLVNLQTLYNQLEDVDKNSRQGIMLLNQILTYSTKVYGLLRNAENFKTAQAQAVSKDALNELAVTNGGLIVRGPNGQIASVSPEEYASLDDKQRAQYSPITNAELITLREESQLMLGDVKSFELLNQSTGFTNIGKQVKDIIGTITLSKSSNTYDLYTDPTGKLKEGLTQLKAISDTPLDNILVTVEQSGNESSVNLALDAMWSTLGDSSKVFLKGRAAMEGYSKEQLETVAKSYLVKLVSPKVFKETTTSQKVDLGPKDKTEGSGSGSKSGGGSGVEFKFWDAFANNRMPKQMTMLDPDGGLYLFTAPIGIYGPMRDSGQKPYQKVSIGSITELGTIADKNSASFGGDMTIINALQKGMAYDGATLGRVTLPYKLDPHTKQPVPNFALLKNYEALVKELMAIEQTGKKLTIGEKQQIFVKNGITDLDINGEPRNTRDFLSTQVYLGEKIYDRLDEASQKLLIEEDNEGLVNIMKGTFNDKPEQGLYEKNDHIYKGMIYYPIYNDAGILSGSLNDAGGIKTGDYDARMMKYQNSVKPRFSMDLLNIPKQ